MPEPANLFKELQLVGSNDVKRIQQQYVAVYSERPLYLKCINC